MYVYILYYTSKNIQKDGCVYLYALYSIKFSFRLQKQIEFIERKNLHVYAHTHHTKAHTSKTCKGSYNGYTDRGMRVLVYREAC